MKKYKRICRICGKELEYGSYSAYYLAEKCNAVCRNCATRKNAKRKCDLSSLLEETPEAYYWIGFLLADGHFQDGRISFHLGLKDKEQVIKFANFISWTGNFEDRGELGIGVRAKHTDAVKQLCEKFDIKSNKTYEPPKTILNHNKDLLKYLLIGFIDGDGTINENCIRFRIHSSWINVLKEFSMLLDLENNPTITKDGYAYLRINKTKALETLLPLVDTIPYLERKWKRIKNIKNETYGCYKISSKTKNIIDLIKSGLEIKEVSEKMGITKDYVLKIKSRYGVEVNRVNKERSEKLKKEILSLLSDGIKYKEISKTLNVSISYISKINKKYVKG
jgi:transposase